MGGFFSFIFGLAGFAIGGPVGYFVGSTIGQALFGGRTVEGPRLTDLKIQTSTYGTALPVVYGTVRLAGNVIWADLDDDGNALIEQEHVERVGGFLGIFGGDKQKTYTYSSSFSVAFCEGPIDGIKRLWMDKKLVYDISDDVDDATLAASQKFSRWFDLCLGTQDQQPSPVMETDKGVGNVPAYKGIARIDFVDLPLANYGNHIPTVEAEIVSSGDLISDGWTEITPTNTYWDPRENAGVCTYNDFMYVFGGGGESEDFSDIWRTQNGDKWELQSSSGYDGLAKYGIRIAVYEGFIYVFGGATTTGGIIEEDEDKLCWKYSISGNSWTGYQLGDSAPAEGDDVGSVTTIGDGYSTWQNAIDSGYNRPLGRIGYGLCTWNGRIYLSGGSGNVAAGTYDNNKDLWYTANGKDWVQVSTDAGFAETGGTGNGREYHTMLVYPHPTTGVDTLWILGGHHLKGDLPDEYSNACYYWNGTTFTKTSSDITGGLAGNESVWGATVWNGKMVAFCAYGSNTTAFFSTDGETWTIDDFYKRQDDIIAIDQGNKYWYIDGDATDSIVVNDHFVVNDSTGNDGIYTIAAEYYDAGNDRTRITSSEAIPDTTEDGNIRLIAELTQKGSADEYPMVATFLECLWIMGGYDGADIIDEIWKSNLHTMTDGTIPLDEVVTDLCERAGLTAGQIDVTDLESDIVRGFVVMNRSSARDALEILSKAYFFDAVISDNKIKFIKRGGASALTITEDDLQAHQPGTDVPDKVIITRNPDLELAQSLDLVYMDVNLDYSDGTQTAQRQTVESNKKETVQFPLVLTADEAAQIAEVMLYNMWNERSTLTFTLPFKYIYLDVTDIITLPVEDETHIVRITQMDILSEKLIQFQGVIENTSIYTQDVSGIEGTTPTTTIKYIPDSTGIFLDLPRLTSINPDDYGFYWTAIPNTSEYHSWRGTSLYGTRDSETTWDFLERVHESGNLNTVYGEATTALGTALSTIWDRGNSLTVTVTNGSLYDYTESEVLQGANRAAVYNSDTGTWEIIGYTTTVDNGSNSWTISTLLRGLFGTEQSITGHAIGDKFVTLSNLARVEQLYRNEIGKSMTYRCVSLPDNDNFSSTNSETFTCNAVCQKPYAPYSITGSRDSDNHWTVSWLWRSVEPHEWHEMGEPKNNENTLDFLVEFLDGVDGDVVFSTVVTLKGDIPFGLKPSMRFLRQYQIKYFSAVQDTLYVRISKVSSVTGVGYKTEGILTA